MPRAEPTGQLVTATSGVFRILLRGGGETADLRARGAHSPPSMVILGEGWLTVSPKGGGRSHYRPPPKYATDSYRVSQKCRATPRASTTAGDDLN